MNFKYRLQQIILIAGDIIGIALALFFSLALRQLSLPNLDTVAAHLPLLGILTVIWGASNYASGLYDLGKLAASDRLRSLFQAAVLSLLTSVVAFYISGNTNVTPKTILILSIILGYFWIGGWRALYTKLTAVTRLQTRIIVVGSDSETLELIDLIIKNPEKSYTVSALFDPTRKLRSNDFDGKIEVYSNVTALRAAITTHKAQMVVTGPGISEDPEIVRELYELLFWPVQIKDFSSLYETITGRVPPSSYSDSWLIANLVNYDHPLYESLRRLLDYVAGIGLGILCVILFPFIALAIRLNSPGPIIFTQVRVGWRGEHFFLNKFRTMQALAPDGSAEKAGAQFADPNDERVTKVGRFLRRTRLDELPQFWNLLRGDITLIGPRPERPEIVGKLESILPYYHLRLLVKPGITGWAAIHQYYAGTLEEAITKLQYDLFYIKNRSIQLDIAIMLRTINVVVRMMGR